MKYIVQNTHIKHGSRDEKEAKVYAPGDEIDLTAEEAKALGENVKPVKAEKAARK